jgi:phosphoribosylamine-glycine ligase
MPMAGSEPGLTSGRGNDMKNLIDQVYQEVEKISFDDMHYRRDIGRKALGGRI